MSNITRQQQADFAVDVCNTLPSEVLPLICRQILLYITSAIIKAV